jgi:hypothetical protein
MYITVSARVAVSRDFRYVYVVQYEHTEMWWNYMYLRIRLDCSIKMFKAESYIWYCFCLIMQDRIERGFAINRGETVQH